MGEIDLGITATRNGLNERQLRESEHLLRVWWSAGKRRLHHGDCVGGDSQLAEIAREIGYSLISHPPTDERYRARVASHAVLPALPYLDRNWAIVDVSSVLIACPSGMKEEIRSGTWATVRYARRSNITRMNNPITICMVWPKEKEVVLHQLKGEGDAKR